MPSRRVALIGCNPKGPAIAIKGVLSPLLRIRGVREGVRVELLLYTASETPQSRTFIGSGDHEIPEADWALVSCESPDKLTICEVISKVA